jgi:hypothetical protein
VRGYRVIEMVVDAVVAVEVTAASVENAATPLSTASTIEAQ